MSANGEHLLARHPPRDPDAPASERVLDALNRHGLLYEAVVREANALGVAILDGRPVQRVTISELTAWEVRAEAQLAGLRI